MTFYWKSIYFIPLKSTSKAGNEGQIVIKVIEVMFSFKPPAGPPSLVGEENCRGSTSQARNIPHPRICNAFYICGDNTRYEPCVFCPEGSFFDSVSAPWLLHHVQESFLCVCRAFFYARFVLNTLLVSQCCRDLHGLCITLVRFTCDS